MLRRCRRKKCPSLPWWEERGAGRWYDLSSQGVTRSPNSGARARHHSLHPRGVPTGGCAPRGDAAACATPPGKTRQLHTPPLALVVSPAGHGQSMRTNRSRRPARVSRNMLPPQWLLRLRVAGCPDTPKPSPLGVIGFYASS